MQMPILVMPSLLTSNTDRVAVENPSVMPKIMNKVLAKNNL